jgi:hypothetical protein
MRRLNKSIAVEYKETKNHAWTHHHSEKNNNACVSRKREEKITFQ